MAYLLTRIVYTDRAILLITYGLMTTDVSVDHELFRFLRALFRNCTSGLNW